MRGEPANSSNATAMEKLPVFVRDLKVVGQSRGRSILGRRERSGRLPACFSHLSQTAQALVDALQQGKLQILRVTAGNLQRIRRSAMMTRGQKRFQLVQRKLRRRQLAIRGSLRWESDNRVLRGCCCSRSKEQIADRTQLVFSTQQ